MRNTNIAGKATRNGNYSVAQMTTKEFADMTQQNIKDAAAIIILKGKPGVQVVSVANMSILTQALCALPELAVSQVSTIIRYVNQLPNGQPLISYYGTMPSDEIIASLAKLARTSSSINGAIFSGYATLAPALGEEKHFSPELTIKSGMTNIRVAKSEVIFAFGSTVKRMTVNDFSTGQWNKATEISSFTKNVLFIDRVQDNVTNVVTEDKIVRSYSIVSKKAAEIHDQSSNLKILSFVQWAKSAVITTPLGITQELAFAKAV